MVFNYTENVRMARYNFAIARNNKYPSYSIDRYYKWGFIRYTLALKLHNENF